MRAIRDEHFITFEMLSASRRFDASRRLMNHSRALAHSAGPTSTSAATRNRRRGSLGSGTGWRLDKPLGAARRGAKTVSSEKKNAAWILDPGGESVARADARPGTSLLPTRPEAGMATALPVRSRGLPSDPASQIGLGNDAGKCVHHPVFCPLSREPGQPPNASAHTTISGRHVACRRARYVVFEALPR